MRLFLVVVALVSIMLVPGLLLGDEIDNHFGGEEGLRRLQEYEHWAWLVAQGLIVSDLVLPVPSTAVIAGLGMIYGPWLGGFQPDGAPEPDGGWQWVTGEEWSYTNWGIGEPNDITGEQYLHFDNLGELAEPSPRWNDYRNDGVFPVHSFIVEYPIPNCGTVVVFALGGVAGRLRRR